MVCNEQHADCQRANAESVYRTHNAVAREHCERAYSGAASAENVMVIARCNTDTQPKARITSKAPIAATAQNSASNKSAP